MNETVRNNYKVHKIREHTSVTRSSEYLSPFHPQFREQVIDEFS